MNIDCFYFLTLAGLVRTGRPDLWPAKFHPLLGSAPVIAPYHHFVTQSFISFEFPSTLRRFKNLLLSFKLKISAFSHWIQSFECAPQALPWMQWWCTHCRARMTLALFLVVSQVSIYLSIIICAYIINHQTDKDNHNCITKPTVCIYPTHKVVVINKIWKY